MNFVMDSCHTHSNFVYQPLVNENMTQTLDNERDEAINERFHDRMTFHDLESRLLVTE